MITSFQYTDKGPRLQNEDSIGIKKVGEFVISCVSDGVGGAACGLLASQTAVSEFLLAVDSFEPDLRTIVQQIHEKILIMHDQNPACRGMAATFTACVASNDSINGVHAGDSRLSILRGLQIMQLTDNHTEVDRLLKRGKLTEEEAAVYPRRHIIESALGITGPLTIQTFTAGLAFGDRILLTSDGVHEIINEAELCRLSVANPALEHFGEGIIALLAQKRLRDNVSFIVMQIV